MEKKLDLILSELQNLTKRLDAFQQKTENNFKEVRGDIQKLSDKIEIQHIENVNSDNLLLTEVRSIREGVLFVNRKVADAEIELTMMKQNAKQ